MRVTSSYQICQREDNSSLIFNEDETPYVRVSSNLIPWTITAQRFSNTFLISGSVTLQTISIQEALAPNESSVYQFYLSQLKATSILYHHVNKKEIGSFLSEHIDLVPSLLSLSFEIFKRFDIRIPNIELVVDQEMPDWKTVFVTIPHQLDFDLAYEKLTDLIQNWAFNQSAEFKKFVTISIL